VTTYPTHWLSWIPSMIRWLVGSRRSYGTRMAMASRCRIMRGIRLFFHWRTGISLFWSSMNMQSRLGLMMGRGLGMGLIWLSKTKQMKTTTAMPTFAHPIPTHDTYTKTANHTRCFLATIRQIDLWWNSGRCLRCFFSNDGKIKLSK